MVTTKQMNSIKTHISHIVLDSHCALISADSVFGTFHALTIESKDSPQYTKGDEIWLRFKENNVFLLPDNTPQIWGFNAFKGQVITYEANSIFTRIALLPLPFQNAHLQDSTKPLESLHTLDSQSTNSHTTARYNTDDKPIYALIPSIQTPLIKEGDIYTWCVLSSHIILEGIA